METTAAGAPRANVPLTNDKRAELLTQARGLEAAFLSEMFGYAGMGATRSAFGGGIGEEQFASFLRQEQAKAIVRQGGIGLAEHIFHALEKRHT